MAKSSFNFASLFICNGQDSSIIVAHPTSVVRLVLGVCFVVRFGLFLLHPIGLLPVSYNQHTLSLIALIPSIYQSCRVYAGKSPAVDELPWHLVPVLLSGALSPSIQFLTGSSTTDFMVGAVSAPLSTALVAFIYGCFHLDDGRALNMIAAGALMLPSFIALRYRASRDPELHWMIGPFLFLAALGIFMGQCLRWCFGVVHIMLRKLRRAIAVTEALRLDLERANAQLAKLREATSSLLSGMCDVVCYLDKQHYFFEPSKQACNLFMPEAEDGASALGGCTIFDFVPEPAEQDRLRQLLEESLGRDCVAAASCINLHMRDASGREFAAVIFHAHLGSSTDTVEGESRHLIGIQIREHRASRSTASTLEPDLIDARQAPLQPLPQPLQLIINEPSADLESYLNNNQLSLAFDAGSLRFDIFHPHPAVRDRTSKAGGTLKSLIYTANWEQFQLWVIAQIQSAPKNAVITTGEYPGNLAVNLCHSRRSRYFLVVHRAWLEIDIPHEGPGLHILPTTLCLEGFSRAQYVLQALTEGDEDHLPDDTDSASSISAHDSASCIAELQSPDNWFP